MLTAVPEASQARLRREGVAIDLSGESVSAWKAGGSKWKLLPL